MPFWTSVFCGKKLKSALTEVWKKLLPILDDFDGWFKTDGGSNHWYNRSSKKTRTKDVTKLLPSYHKRTDEKLLPMDEQRKWFLHIESTPGEDATKIVEITGFRIVHKLKW